MFYLNHSLLGVWTGQNMPPALGNGGNDIKKLIQVSHLVTASKGIITYE